MAGEGVRFGNGETGSEPGPGTTRPFLTDFGLAKSIATGSKLTRSGQALGTPAYMSPEQGRGEVSSLTPATDVWSLGCVLYEAITHRHPFTGEDPVAVIAQVLVREPAALRILRPEVPPGLATLVRATLAKRPRPRPRDGGALRDDLDRVLRGERPRARSPRVVRPAFALLALAAAAAVAAVGMVPPRGRSSPVVRPGPPGEVSPATALLRRARSVRLQDPARAAEVLRPASESSEADPEVLRELADCWREAGHWHAAEAAYARLLAADPGDVASRAGRGLACWLGRQDGESGLPDPTEDLAAAAGGDPGPRGALARGVLAWRAGHLPEAESALEAAGDSWERFLVQALLRHHLGGAEGQERAARELSQVIERAPPLAYVYMERGHARDMARDHAGAVEDLTEALRLRPQYPMALNARGAALDNLGEFRRAEEDFSAAIRAKPDLAVAYYNRGVVRRRLGEPVAALEDYTSALRHQPDFREALKNRASVRKALGDVAGAVEDYTEAIRRWPEDDAAHVNRGNLRLDRRELAEAIEDYSEALRLRPGNPRAAHGLAEAHRHRRDWRAAADAYRAFLRIAPGDPREADARRRLAECEARMRAEESGRR
ncbi:MAG: tetratricopeptide repeat protein [Planctomycetales bacterium]|nr:tetratricopeptide repeat protein [Planctomycetales bacterium]